MEIDAIFMLIKMLKDDDSLRNDFLVMESYICNKNIDINLSLRENIGIILNEDEDLTNDSRIADIVNSEEKFLDKPIYSLLLGDAKMRSFILEAENKKLLSEDTVLDIVEMIIMGIEAIEDSVNREQTIRFLMEVISRYRVRVKSKIQSSPIINAFVKKYENITAKERGRGKNFQDGFYYRILLYKLFSYGYVTFDYNQVLNSESEENGLETLVVPLIESRSYGHLTMMINKITVNKNVSFLKNIVKQGLSHLYDEDVEEDDIRKDKDFIERINTFLKSVNEEILDYEDLIKKSDYKLS